MSDQHSGNHKPYDPRELEQADATAYALGELSAADSAQFERNQAQAGEVREPSSAPSEKTKTLGRFLRGDLSGRDIRVDSNSAEYKACSEHIRDSVAAALDSQETSRADKPLNETPLRSRARILAWSTVACLAVAIGGLATWSRFYDGGQSQQVADTLARQERQVSHKGEQTELAAGKLMRIVQEETGRNDASRFRFQPVVELGSAPSAQGIQEAMKTASASRPELAASGRQGQPDTDGQLAESSQKSLSRSAVVAGVNLSVSGDEASAVGRVIGGTVVPKGPIPSVDSGVRTATNANPDGGTLMLGGLRRAPSSTTQLTLGEPMFGANSADAFARDRRVDDVLGGDGNQNEEQDEGGRYDLGSRRNTDNEQYKSLPENPFWRPLGERAMSTFSIDVDTASYANVRRFLNEGSLPPPEAVRLEEFINYFHYDYPQPDGDLPFAVDLKLFGCPWNAQHSLLRVGLHGREIESTQRPISNIVYLVDVSGSMSSDDKLPLLKRGLQIMVDQLSENDTVSIVTYAGEAGVRLEPTNGANKKRILDAIDSLQSGGSTNGAAGIEVA